jgi:hypothetical protein
MDIIRSGVNWLASRLRRRYFYLLLTLQRNKFEIVFVIYNEVFNENMYSHEMGKIHNLINRLILVSGTPRVNDDYNWYFSQSTQLY